MQATDPVIYQVHNDHLGTPKAMTDEMGVVVWRATHTPFGTAEVDMVTSTVELNVRFPGQYFDAETELHYNFPRYYDPSTGRYLRSDPIGLNGGVNPYSYSAGNALRFTDSRGLEPDLACVTAWTLACSVAGGAAGYHGGGAGGGALGALRGSVAGPGGTVAGGVAGAVGGSNLGGVVGAAAGGALGNALGNALCPDGSAPPKKPDATHPSPWRKLEEIADLIARGPKSMGDDAGAVVAPVPGLQDQPDAKMCPPERGSSESTPPEPTPPESKPRPPEMLEECYRIKLCV